MTQSNYLKVISTTVLITFSCSNIIAQNLVPNGSFEDTIPCAIGNPNQLPCPPWDSPTGGSPDYCSSIWSAGCLPSFISAPLNAFGYQFALTGVAYCGFSTYATSPAVNYREYLQCPLVTPLISGNYYYVTFYVTASNNSHYVVDRIGACFTDSAIHAGGYHILNYLPQVENDSGNIIYDTLNWTLISGYFYATGGEKYITIGNFRKDNKTLIDTISGTQFESYYYIDDVSVIDCTATAIKKNNVVKFQLLQNPVNENLQWVASERITKSYIYDITGKLIQSDDFQQMQSTYRVNVAYLRQGMYLLIVEDKNKRRGMRKFVKE